MEKLRLQSCSQRKGFPMMLLAARWRTWPGVRCPSVRAMGVETREQMKTMIPRNTCTAGCGAGAADGLLAGGMRHTPMILILNCRYAVLSHSGDLRGLTEQYCERRASDLDLRGAVLSHSDDLDFDLAGIRVLSVFRRSKQ